MVILLATATEMSGWVCTNTVQSQHALIIGGYMGIADFI